MRILVLNCGSSSIKYQFIDMNNLLVLAEGIAERIGEDLSLFTYKSEKYTLKKKEMVIENHEQGLQLIIDYLLDPVNGVIKDKSEIDAVGHRLVHAGEYYSDAVVITDDVVRVMKECIPLAPLHNPANIKGIEAVKKNVPEVPQCGLFDTAYHQTMPPRAYLYPQNRKSRLRFAALISLASSSSGSGANGVGGGGLLGPFWTGNFPVSLGVFSLIKASKVSLYIVVVHWGFAPMVSILPWSTFYMSHVRELHAMESTVGPPNFF